MLRNRPWQVHNAAGVYRWEKDASATGGVLHSGTETNRQRALSRERVCLYTTLVPMQHELRRVATGFLRWVARLVASSASDIDPGRRIKLHKMIIHQPFKTQLLKLLHFATQA